MDRSLRLSGRHRGVRDRVPGLVLDIPSMRAVVGLRDRLGPHRHTGFLHAACSRPRARSRDAVATDPALRCNLWA